MNTPALEIPAPDDRRYSDIHYHAAGSEAEVYAAVYTPTGQPVALKVLIPRGGAAVVRERRERRFVKEASLLREAGGAHVARVYEVLDVRLRGEATKAFSMEWLPETLHAQVSRSPEGLRIRDLDRWFGEALEGLGALHHAGVAVRDLRPENLLLSERGELKIADLGMARTDDSAASLVESSRYMAPEVLDGSIRAGDSTEDPPAAAYFSVDVYALGLIFYEASVGPERWESLPSLRSVHGTEGIGSALDRNMRWREWHLDRAKRLEPVAAVRRDLPPGLAAAIDGMVEKERARRVDLEKARQFAQDRQKPPPPPPPRRRRALRKWLYGAAAIVLGGLTLIGVVWIAPSRERRATAPQSARPERAATTPVELAPLRIVSDPQGAQVYVDDVLRGVTPINVSDLEDGKTYEVRIAKDGFAERKQRIRPGPSLRSFQVKLAAAPAAPPAIPPSPTADAARPERPLSVAAIAAPAREGPQVQPEGHREPVFDLVYSGDGRYVLSGGSAEVKLWDVRTGRLVRTLRGAGGDHAVWHRYLGFTPDGKRIVSTRLNGDGVGLWDANTGRMLKSFYQGGFSDYAAAVSHDGSYVASGGADKKVRIWNAASAALIHELPLRRIDGYEFKPSTLLFSPDDRFVVAYGEYLLSLWETGSGTLKWQQDGASYFVGFTPDGKFLVTDTDNALQVRDVRDGSVVRAFSGFPADIRSVAFDLSGGVLLAAGARGQLLLWDFARGAIVKSFRPSPSDGFVGCAFSPDGRSVLSGDWDGNVIAWSVQDAAPVRLFNAAPRADVALRYCQDGSCLLAGDFGGDMWKWDFARWRLVHQGRLRLGPGAGNIWFASDARSALARDRQGNLETLDLSTGRRIVEWNACPGEQNNVVCTDWRCFTADLSFGLEADFRSDRMRLRDAHRPDDLLRPLQESWPATDVVLWNAVCAFSPDGERVAVQGGSEVALWDTASGRRLWTHEFRRTTTSDRDAVSYSPTGKSVVAAGAPGIVVMKSDSGEDQLEIRTEWGIRELAVSPDERVIASVGMYGNSLPLGLWDFKTGNRICSKDREQAGRTIYSTSFRPDSRALATATERRGVVLWDVSTCHEIARLLAFPDGEWAIVTPEGWVDGSEEGLKRLAVTDEDGASRPLTVARPDLINRSKVRAKILRGS